MSNIQDVPMVNGATILFFKILGLGCGHMDSRATTNFFRSMGYQIRRHGVAQPLILTV